jgi:hypothetical protein
MIHSIEGPSLECLRVLHDKERDFNDFNNEAEPNS